MEDVEEMIKTGEERPDRRLRGVAEELVNGCSAYSRLVKGTGGNAVGRTKLDRERHKMCLREMVNNFVQFFAGNFGCGIRIIHFSKFTFAEARYFFYT